MSFSKLDYCQFLIGSQVNYTLTNLADHLQSWSHDTINRYLRGEQLPPRLLWENAREVMEFDEGAYIVFDDTVLDKQFGHCIEMTRRQWSGNEHRVNKASAWCRVFTFTPSARVVGSWTTAFLILTATARPNSIMWPICWRACASDRFPLAQF